MQGREEIDPLPFHFLPPPANLGAGGIIFHDTEF